MMLIKEIRNIDRNNFQKYGDIIDLRPESVDGWDIPVKVGQSGWRIAVLEFSWKTAKKLECHHDSRESFEPLQGIPFLIVAEKNNPDSFEVFLLDKPVCLNENIWHQLISCSGASKIKITENLDVTSEFYELKGEVKPCFIQNIKD